MKEKTDEGDWERVTFSLRRRGGEITETNLSGGAGAMLLTAYWNALNSCLFNYANVHMQMTTVRNTMLSQLGDRLTRVGFRERPDYCPAIRLQANSFWPVIIITRHQQGVLTRRLRSDVLFACECMCWLHVWETVDVRLHMSCLLVQLSTALPPRTNQLLRGQTHSRSARVICLCLSHSSSLYTLRRSNRTITWMWVKLHNVTSSNDWSPTCIKLLHKSFLNWWIL